MDPLTLAPLARLGELRALRLALSFQQQSAAGWDFLRSMPHLTLLHLSNDGACRMLVAMQQR